MRKIAGVFLCCLLAANFANARSYFKTVNSYYYSNDTLYVEIISSIRATTDVCNKIAYLGADSQDNGNIKTLKLYYHTPQSTGGGVPTDCIITDTLSITPVTVATHMIELSLFTVAPLTPNTGDTTDVNSRVVIFLPLNIAEKHPNSNAISLHPNPAKDVIYISGMSTDTKIELFDITGRKVHSSLHTDCKAEVNINALPYGTYIVKLTDADGYSKTVKFSKE